MARSLLRFFFVGLLLFGLFAGLADVVDDGLGLADENDFAVGARNRTLDQQQMLFLIDANHREVTRGAAFIAKVAGHFLALLDRAAVTAGTLAAADAAGRTMLTFRTV